MGPMLRWTEPIWLPPWTGRLSGGRGERLAMTTKQRDRKGESDQLYEQYGKPLERDHEGDYLAIAPDGRTLMGHTLLDVAQRAKEAFGPGSFLFKIGPKAVGKWR